jgi:hypothetical protein
MRTSSFVAGACVAGLLAVACEDKGKVSVEQASAHVQLLVETAQADVEEIRRGLPEGAGLLVKLYQADAPPKDDREAVRAGLARARSSVQDLRVAKATFFALVDEDGTVLRNDQEQDLMADRNVYAAFPELKQALAGKYVETRGSMEEARGVAEPKPDAQWVAAAPVTVDAKAAGLYLAGWSFSSYAYRLEFKLRGAVRAALLEEKDPRKNEPLLYVHIAVERAVYGAPVSPALNNETLRELDLVSKTDGDRVHAQVLEITGRTFGVAARRAPALGDAVAVVVLRSET